MDEWLRNIFFFGVLIGFTVYFVGGWISDVAGIWQDGQRQLKLSQFGPWIWGRAVCEGGYQRFWGRVWFGRLRLYRYDYGRKHVESLGFAPEHAEAVEGQCTGCFVFRLWAHPTRLSGSFIGRKFTLKNQRMLPIANIEPAPREWTRVTDSAQHEHAS